MRPEDLPCDYVLKRRTVIDAARKWIGTPYRHQGRNARGMDCVGLIIMVAKELNDNIAGLQEAYTAQPQGWMLIGPCEERMWKPERQDRIIPGDIVVFTGMRASEPQHFGIAGDNPRGGVSIIHSFAKFGQVLEMPWNRVWEKKFFCIYNFKGTEEAFS